MLSADGFEEIRVATHLLKSWISGGMLLEAARRKRAGRRGRSASLRTGPPAGIMKNHSRAGGPEA